MTTYGYARVSTDDQDLTIQHEALKAAGCTVIRSEKKSGTSRKGRAELAILMDFLQKGDTLVITRIDRLARSMLDLQQIVHELKAKGVSLKATEHLVRSQMPTALSANGRRERRLCKSAGVSDERRQETGATEGIAARHCEAVR